MISQRVIRTCQERFRLDPSIAPECLDIVLDGSLSMTSGDGSKEQIARELATVLLLAAASAGRRGQVQIVRGNQRDRQLLPADAAKLAQIPFDGINTLAHWHENESPDGQRWRVVLSDLLFPDDPEAPLARLSQGCTRFWFVQILDPTEITPQPLGPSVLVDIESDERLVATLDRATIRAYAERLSTLQDHWRAACTRHGGTLVIANSGLPLESVCESLLVPAGLLCESEPRKV